MQTLVALPTRLAEPVAGRLEAAGATFRVRPGSPSHCRCSLLRACCYARLAARRCRVGPIQPLLVPRAGIPTCTAGTWCQRGACRCERAARLCRIRGLRLPRRRSKCRGRAGRR
ncbi:basic myotoxic phospholipase A2 PhTX-II-like isoform 2-T2 [Sarcoramphus papa]